MGISYFQDGQWSEQTNILIVLVMIVMNVLGMIMMGYDKRQARNNAWRIPESRLFLTAFFGGALGILIGMKTFRHKTKHWSFRIGVPLLVIMNISVVILLVWLPIG